MRDLLVSAAARLRSGGFFNLNPIDMNYESKIKWMAYPQHKPETRGRYMVISNGIVGVGYYSKIGENWKEVFGHTMGLPSTVSHWAHFPDALPIQVEKEAAPAWEGVDPDKFMDEVRGRSAGLEWKKGAPDMSGKYFFATTLCRSPYPEQYDPDDEEWDNTEILYYIGPIPPVPTE